jgi:hypothetical protein
LVSLTLLVRSLLNSGAKRSVFARGLSASLAGVAYSSEDHSSLLDVCRNLDLRHKPGLPALGARDIDNRIALATHEVMVPLFGILIESSPRPYIGNHKYSPLRQVSYNLEDGTPGYLFALTQQKLVHVISGAMTSHFGQGSQNGQSTPGSFKANLSKLISKLTQHLLLLGRYPARIPGIP